MADVHQYILNDSNSISIAPAWGCNLFSWIVDGKELMYCPPDLPETARKITGGGNPILFPSVGRTWDLSSGEPVPGRYRIYGDDKAYFMPSHGILFLSEFRKVRESQTAERVAVVYETRVSEKIREENYRFDLSFAQSYTLRPGSVELESVITNHDRKPAPCAFGYHPYFAISNPQREGITVRLPVTRELLMTPDTILPTGESQPSEGVFNLLDGIYYDRVFAEPTGTRMSLVDRRAGHTVNVDFDEKCELFLIYSPGESDFVCIEPWTRGLGVYGHLNEPGWEDGRLIPVLQPGETVRYGARFGVSGAGDL